MSNSEEIELPLFSPRDTRTMGNADTEEATTNRRRRMRITDLTVEISSSRNPLTNSTSIKQQIQPARWRTTEFKLYYLIAASFIAIMVWIPTTLSSSEHPNYKYYEHRLRPGWIFGREYDNSDIQYRSFRGNLPPLVFTASGFLIAKFVMSFFPRDKTLGYLPFIPFNVVFSLVMIMVLHGTGAIKVLAILTVNFIIAKTTKGTKLGPLITWVFNGAILFANEIYRGYRFGNLMTSLSYLDGFQGIYPRWHIIFNITMLRLISFNMDLHWATLNADNVSEPSDTVLTDKQRGQLPHPSSTYSFVNYIAYVLYPPLYIAGPIMTFNDFMWQHRRPINFPKRDTLMYLVRFVFTFMTMEFILHYMYVVAIKEEKAWMGTTPAQISMIGFWNLIIVWLKLLIPWRFFRLWAMADGILAPENMIRCMANNYSTQGFWRSWHRSYNLWILRYIYVPMGGGNNRILNTLFVFSFVALWHDLTFRLLAWGWLISLFIIPEVLAAWLLPRSQYGAEPWYRHVCAIGAVLNILMMMVANLIGFVIGMDGIGFFLSQIFGTLNGIYFLVVTLPVMFVGVQLMFEYREEELRNGIVRGC